MHFSLSSFSFYCENTPGGIGFVTFSHSHTDNHIIDSSERRVGSTLVKVQGHGDRGFKKVHAIVYTVAFRKQKASPTMKPLLVHNLLG